VSSGVHCLVLVHINNSLAPTPLVVRCFVFPGFVHTGLLLVDAVDL